MNLRFMASGVLAAAAVVAAGCGAGADLSSVAKAANKTASVKTLKFSISANIQGQPDASGDGVLDFSANSGRLAMREAGGSDFEVIWNGSTQYFKGLPSADFGVEKPWIKISDDDDEFAFPLALFDPARQFALLQKAGRFEANGTEALHGIATARYEGSVDAKKFAEEFQTTAFEDGDSQPVESGTFPVTVWIDGQGLVRKVVYEFPDMGPDDPAGKLVVELYAFGEPVDTSPPPADQVGEFNPSGYTVDQTETTHSVEPLTTGG